MGVWCIWSAEDKVHDYNVGYESYDELYTKSLHLFLLEPILSYSYAIKSCILIVPT